LRRLRRALLRRGLLQRAGADSCLCAAAGRRRARVAALQTQVFIFLL